MRWYLPIILISAGSLSISTIRLLLLQDEEFGLNPEEFIREESTVAFCNFAL